MLNFWRGVYIISDFSEQFRISQRTKSEVINAITHVTSRYRARVPLTSSDVSDDTLNVFGNCKVCLVRTKLGVMIDNTE